MRSIGTKIQAPAQLSFGRQVVQPHRRQPAVAVALVSRRKTGMEPIKAEAFHRAFGVKTDGALQLQRVRVVDSQPAQGEGAIARGGVENQRHGVAWKFRKNGTEQQIAAAQARVQIDLGSACRCIQVEPSVCVEPLGGKRARRRIKTNLAQCELPGRLQPRVTHVQCQLSIEPATSGMARPDRTQQTLQPAGGQRREIDLHMAWLVQRQQGRRACFALGNIQLQGIGRGAQHHRGVRIAQSTPWRVRQLHVAVENPAQLGVTLKASIQRQANAVPAMIATSDCAACNCMRRPPAPSPLMVIVTDCNRSPGTVMVLARKAMSARAEGIPKIPSKSSANPKRWLDVKRMSRHSDKSS